MIISSIVFGCLFRHIFLLENISIASGFHKLKNEGGYVLELEQDMVTIKTPEKLLFPKEGSKAFKGHEFFEASSIRKSLTA